MPILPTRVNRITTKSICQDNNAEIAVTLQPAKPQYLAHAYPNMHTPKVYKRTQSVPFYRYRHRSNLAILRIDGNKPIV